MVFGKLLGKSKKKKAAAPVIKEPGRPKAKGLGTLLEQGITLSAERKALLAKGLSDGLEFYKNYNESRLGLAFDSFDTDMKKALFEIIYLLHVNDPSLAKLAYNATRKGLSKGIPETYQVDDTADLYMEGAPHGIQGIGELSQVFSGELQSFIQENFGRGLAGGANGGSPIVCLQSIGSIGTVGHKSGSSDLDLQVIYDLNTAAIDPAGWDDKSLRKAISLELNWWKRQLMTMEKPTSKGSRPEEIERTVKSKAANQISKKYPNLYNYLIAGNTGYTENLVGSIKQPLRSQLLNEIMALIRWNTKQSRIVEVRAQEKLLKERVARLQKYIEEKYPTAEIYMFTMDIDMYRAGRYTSSLEFKESSGSAYELILNYETLMPGIQFTATIPTHFIFPKIINDDGALYQRLQNYVVFKAIDVFDEVAPLLVDLGHTPELGEQYVVAHRGAVYWEAFKASAGNLPKATLNLLRFEMMLNKPLLKTIIQIIKEPGCIDHMIAPATGDRGTDQAALEKGSGGVPGWVLTDLEKEHPPLLFDPWWLRYKALKIGFEEEKGVPGLERGQRDQISKLIDLAFALHVRISDVFTKPGDTRAFDTHREQVLLKFLSKAFPPGTDKREFLEHIFAGEVRALNHFELELRANFRYSLQRTQKRFAKFDLKKMRRGNREIQLWHHFYEKNFEPQPNVVRRNIMNHLQFPRGRLQIGFEIGEGWIFKSLQKESGVGKRFDTFGILDHLPEEVTLIEGTTFLYGLATCILNRYYGVFDQGKLKERRTAIEFNAARMNLGKEMDDTLAFVRPDHIDRILLRILAFFPEEYHNYLEFLREDRRVKKIFLFLNLWKFGRLSILYRDNLGTIRCDEFDHPLLEAEAASLTKNHEEFLAAPQLFNSLDRFLRDQTLYIDEVELATWVNPNSLETTISATKAEQKEDFLAEAYMREVLDTHPKKGG